MEEYQQSNDLHIENDKWNAPFLLAASFHNLIQFVGSFHSDGILYWQFTPKDKAELLVDQFRTKTCPPIPPRDLFEAIDVFWRQVSGKRNGEMNYGRRKP